MDQGEMSTLYRGPPIDASYPVSVHLAKRFQRRRISKISDSEIRVACGGHVCKWIGMKVVESIYGRFSMGIVHSVFIR
jgi:hypothetical protein